MATATEQRPITFISHRHNRRFVIEPELNEQRDVRNRIIEPHEPAKDIIFDGGQFVTTDPEEIKYLREHALFNNSEMGFYELGNAPDEPRPTSAEQIDVIVAASAARDAEILRALITEEEATHRREHILNAAHKALDCITNESDPEAEAEGKGETTTPAEADTN